MYKNTLAYIVALVILLFFSACQSEYKKEVLQNTHIQISNERITIPIDDSTKYFSLRSGFYQDKDTAFFYYVNRNCIQIFDMKRAKLIRKIYVPNVGPNGVGDIANIAFISPDTLVLGTSRAHKLFFCTFKENFTIDEVYNYEHLADKIVECDFGVRGTQVIRDKDYLYFTTASPYFSIQNYSPTDKFSKDLSKGFFAARYSLNSKAMELLPCTIPNDYFEKGMQGMNCSTIGAYRKGAFFYSFFANDKMYITDESHKNLTVKTIRSKDVNIEGEPEGDIPQLMQFAAERGSYYALIYDKYRDVFYRIVQENTELSADENPGDLFQTPPRFGIMVLNPDLNIIEELSLPRGKFFAGNSFVDERGLWLSENHPLNKAVEEDSLRFTCIKWLKNEN